MWYSHTSPCIPYCLNFKNGPSSASFSFIFSSFQTNNLKDINVKNVHPACGDGTRTHDLNMSLLPKSLVQGSHTFTIPKCVDIGRRIEVVFEMDEGL